MELKKFIAIFILIAVLLMPVAVFADVPIPDPPPGAFHYWVVVSLRNGNIRLFTSNNPITVPKKGTQLYAHNCRMYILSDNSWNYEWESLSHVSSPFEHMYAANHDIAYDDGSGFFFTPPKVSEFCQAVRQVKNKGTFGMILRTISAGLIPVLGCLILAISLRKGWAFLQGQLRH